MQYQQFTPEMRKTHTILVPNMLPIHFRLLISIFGQFGYHMELLESSSRTVVEEGLKNVHNDTCYPALRGAVPGLSIPTPSGAIDGQPPCVYVVWGH